MNSLINAIEERSSCPRLSAPAPDRKTLDTAFKAALNVPDHAQLKPWRFLFIEGDARLALGKLFAQSKLQQEPQLAQAEIEKTESKAMRAPLIVIAISRGIEHPKVPELEQQLSTACVVHNLTLILRSLGYGSVWRTGTFAFDPLIQSGLGLKEEESIIAYLYIGTPAGRNEKTRDIKLVDFISDWTG